MVKDINASKEEMLAAIRECAATLGHPPSTAELIDIARLNIRMLRRCFGSYTKALRAAGMKGQGNIRVSVDTLFSDWAEVVRKLGKIPTISEYEGQGKYSVRPFLRQFGKWTNVAHLLGQYVERECITGGWEDVMATIRASYEVRRAEDWKRQPLSGPESGQGSEANAKALALPGRPMYGAHLGMPALAHAPINEMGVVYLFGALAVELGFMVTRIQSEFPDCEAMWRVDKDRCQRVLIEFESESRNFRTHRHDPKKCDLIVCWIHNWPECPLPVLELKSLVEKGRIANGASITTA